MILLLLSFALFASKETPSTTTSPAAATAPPEFAVFFVNVEFEILPSAIATAPPVSALFPVKSVLLIVASLSA